MSDSKIRILPWLWHPTNLVSSWLLRLRHRVTVVSHGRRPTGAVLVAAKHGSGWDIPAMSWQVHALLGLRSNFQMGSFVGYAVLGRIVPLLRVCGGFPVMRPKEILRLKERRGLTKDEAMQVMASINAEADDVRREILDRGQPLVFFPEGTRDNDHVRPIRGTHEIESAVAASARGVSVEVWPVLLRYGPPTWRRDLRIDFLEPFGVAGLTSNEIAERIHAAWTTAWHASASDGFRGRVSP